MVGIVRRNQGKTLLLIRLTLIRKRIEFTVREDMGEVRKHEGNQKKKLRIRKQG